MDWQNARASLSMTGYQVASIATSPGRNREPSQVLSSTVKAHLDCIPQCEREVSCFSEVLSR
jgi:hypothetical protein